MFPLPIASMTIPLYPISTAWFINVSSIPIPDLNKATLFSTWSVSIKVLWATFLYNKSSLLSTIPKEPLAGDWKVFKAIVSVLVASDANNTSLFKTTRTPLFFALSDMATQTADDRLFEPS